MVDENQNKINKKCLIFACNLTKKFFYVIVKFFEQITKAISGPWS